jgi:hypothetical protein
MPNVNFDPTIARIVAPDGSVFQVLNEVGDDWDEPATRVEYEIWSTGHA